MRKITSILCSIAFLLSGVMMAITASDPSPGTGYKTMNAGTVPVLTYDMPNSTVQLPQDLYLDLKKPNDTVFITVTKTDTIEKKVQTVKWRRTPAPKPVVVRDTIREAHYYLAKQVGNKEGPTGECIPIYEVHKVDEICPEIPDSCVDNDVGD